MVSKCFAADCSNYYKRCKRLEQLIESNLPADDDFMATLNSGPMYATHCCQFVGSYVNKFNRHLLMKDTVLSHLKNIIKGCPPMDIYYQIPFMEELVTLTYVVAKGVKATEALSALTNKFSIIECNIAYEIAYYKTLLSILGEDCFNQIFDRNGVNPFIVTASASGNKETALKNFISIDEVLSNNDSTQKHFPPLTLQEGIVHYFSNHRDYIRKHPGGIARGFNVMLVNRTDDDLYFTAFGFHGDGLRPHDINQKLVDLFNIPAYDDYKLDLLYENLEENAKAQLYIFKDKTITLDEFYANQGGWTTSRGDFLDINKIKINLRHFAFYHSIPHHITNTQAGVLTGSSYYPRRASI